MIAKRRNFISTTGLAVLAATMSTAVVDLDASERAQQEQVAVQQIARYCNASWRNARIAEQDWADCTQQAFERLLQKIPREQMEQAIGCRESQQRRELNRSIWATIQRWRRASRHQSLTADVDPVCQSEVDLTAAREQIDLACQHLTDRQRTIIQLWMKGHKAADIAEQLQIKPARVSDEKYKALKTLRNVLGAEGLSS